MRTGSVLQAPEGVVVARDGDLFAVSLASGAEVRLTTTLAWESAPAVSPDGQTIVYERTPQRSKEPTLWKMQFDGSRQSSLRVSGGSPAGLPTARRSTSPAASLLPTESARTFGAPVHGPRNGARHSKQRTGHEPRGFPGRADPRVRGGRLRTGYPGGAVSDTARNGQVATLSKASPEHRRRLRSIVGSRRVAHRVQHWTRVRGAGVRGSGRWV